MSFFPGKDPAPGDKYQCDALKTVIVPRTADLGDGFTVRRALPSVQSRMVGPFVFFDHFGPTVFKSGNGLDVRPHPHIGLATVTYLFDGEIMHRDSLGTAVPIRPGEVNWMTAGRGIVHSERTGTERRAKGDSLHGLQMWVALPAAKEEMEPAFAHHAVDEFPMVRGQRHARCAWWSAAPTAGARRSCPRPRRLFADAMLKAGSTLPFDADHVERAIYVIDGEIDIAGDRFGGGRLLVFKPGDRITHPRGERRAYRAVRRRAARRPAPHLVEFRVVAQGPHRAGQGGMGRGPLPEGAGRRDRVRSRCRRSDPVTFAYIVRCDFTDPGKEQAWNDWYSGPKIAQMLRKPHFRSCQRFRRTGGDGRNYLALWTLDSPDAFKTQEYTSDWGFFEWEQHITNWSRDLFDGGAAREDDFAVPPGGALEVVSFDGVSAADAETSRAELSRSEPTSFGCRLPASTATRR